MTTPLDSGEEIFLVVDIERFRGPLELLLHLIRQQDIDIFEIPISKITRQFLSAISDISAGQIANAGESKFKPCYPKIRRPRTMILELNWCIDS
jgi:hypothetical protein